MNSSSTNMLQIIANTMENERFKLKNAANTVEMAASSSQNAANSKENGQRRKSKKKQNGRKKVPQTIPDPLPYVW